MAKSPHTGQSMVGLSLSPETSVVSAPSSMAASPGDFEAGDFDVGDFDGDLARGDFCTLLGPFGDRLVGGFAGMASSG